MTRPAAVAALLLLAAPTPPRADAPEHGKAATADASPVDPGALEAEIAYAPAWNDAGGSMGFDRSAGGDVHGVAGALAYGVARDVDVKLSAGFGSAFDASGDGRATPRNGLGASDAVAGARWRFLADADRGLELAITGELVIPIGARGTATQLPLTQGYWSGRGGLVATKDVGSLTTNAEVAWTAPFAGDARGLRATFEAGAAAGWQLRPWLQPEVELRYATDLGPDRHLVTAVAGVVAPLANGRRIVAAYQHDAWGHRTGQTSGLLFAFKTTL